MSTLYARDSSFFTVEVLDLPSGFSIVPKHLIDLSITEEMGKMDSGSLTLLDNEGTYSRILRNYVHLSLIWGYSSKNMLDVALAGSGDYFSKQLQRRSVKMSVVSPGGGGSENGVTTYRCNLQALDYRGESKNKVWCSGNKGEIIRETLVSMGISDVEVFFTGMDKAYDANYVEAQAESDFQFLSRLSYEWGCVFRIGVDQKGNTIAMFVSPNHLNGSNMAARLASSDTGYTLFEYGPTAMLPNVTNYDWQNQEGENGAGDNINIVWVNGQAVFQRFTVENDHVITWQLDLDKVDSAHKKALAEGGFVGDTQYTAAIAVITDFRNPNIQALWKQVDQVTAPNGLGYTVTPNVLGDPTIGPGLMARFGNGFPDCIRNNITIKAGHGGTLFQTKRPIDFFIKKVTHTLSAAGYRSAVEAVDFISISPTGLRL